MKKIAFLLSAVFLISACSSTKDLSSTRTENRKLKKLAEQAEVKKAVESRRYIIKVNRLYVRGGMIEMIPTTNFVIVNGEIASISLGYVGNSFGSRRITGINLNGRTANYRMESDNSKGLYKIQMSVTYGSDKFDVYLTIGTSGDCNISLNNAFIQTVRYTGTLVPLGASNLVPVEKSKRI
jgi:hypothetical protein